MIPTRFMPLNLVAITRACCGTGGTVSSTSYKSVFSTVISMVLALFLLQLHSSLHKDNFLFSRAAVVF